MSAEIINDPKFQEQVKSLFEHDDRQLVLLKAQLEEIQERIKIAERFREVSSSLSTRISMTSDRTFKKEKK